MKTRGFILFFTAAFCSLFSSCEKTETFSSVPVISFKEFIKYTNAFGIDDSVKAVINFTDGDGDIGLKENETESPYDVNLYITFYEKKNGTFIASPDPITNRIPYLQPQGRNKALKGEIAVKVPLPGGVTNDTIRLDIYLKDRALNKSNIVTTSELVITH